MSDEAPDISVVVPVYGCRAALPELHRRVAAAIEGMGRSFELVLVDDCCPQGSWEAIREACAADARVVGVRLSRNFGQIRAITAGLDEARGDWVVVMDCDLQDRPEAIPLLWERAQEGYDAVFARRVSRKDSASTKLLSRCFYRAYSYFTDGAYDPSVSNFSIVSRQVADSYRGLSEHNRGYATFVRWLGYRQATVDVEGDERYEGRSSYTMRRKLGMATDLITSQSTKPLRLAVNLGFLLATLAMLFLLYVVVRHALDPGLAVGWASVVGSVFLLGGLNIAIVGIVGIYIGNIFDEVKNRPLYLVAERLNGKEEKWS